MGFLSRLVGGADAATVVEKTGNALDKLFTSKDEKLTHAEVMERIKQNPQEWQSQANNIAAAHRSVFVAGARPAIIWVSALGLSFVFVINPILQWVTGQPGPDMPTDSMMELTIAVLGLGAMRTVEKVSGAAK